VIGWLLIAPAWALDLDEARAKATTRAIEVQRDEAAVERARAGDLQALAGALPQIGLFAEASVASGPNPFGRFTSQQVQVGVSGEWRLIDPSAWSAKAAARSSVHGAQALLDWSRVTARRDATIRYAEAVAAVEVAEALRTAEQDAQRAAAGVQSLTRAGLRPRADAAQAEAAAAALTAQRVAAEGEIGATCAALQSLIGVAIDGHCELAAPSTWPDAGTTDALHPALRAAEAALQTARRDRGATLAESAPAIVATGSVAQNEGSAIVGGDTDNARDLSGLSLSAGLRADVPLIGSGSRIGRIKEATADRTTAAVALEEQERLLAWGRVAAEAHFAAALAAAEASSESVRAASEALELVEARYQQGLDGLTTWLDARRARDEALVALAEARAEQGRALAELEANRGILTSSR